MVTSTDCLHSQNWLVNDSGDYIALNLEELTLPEKPYRLYRFLTELEDILDNITDDCLRIQAIMPLVRKWSLANHQLTPVGRYNSCMMSMNFL
jgi:hypothetical protein